MATANDANQPQQDSDTLGAEAQGLREQQLPAGEQGPGRSAAVTAAPGGRGLKPTCREKNILAQRLWRLKQKVRLRLQRTTGATLLCVSLSAPNTA